jgi:hypothetical protein
MVRRLFYRDRNTDRKGVWVREVGDTAGGSKGSGRENRPGREMQSAEAGPGG